MSQGPSATPELSDQPGLRSLVLLFGGIALTLIPNGRDVVHAGFDIRVVFAAVLYGVIVGVAMGIDFPGSSRRFARLASP